MQHVPTFVRLCQNMIHSTLGPETTAEGKGVDVYGFVRGGSKVDFLNRIESAAKPEVEQKDVHAALKAFACKTFKEDYVGAFVLVPHAHAEDGRHLTVFSLFEDSHGFAEHIMFVKKAGVFDTFMATKETADGVSSTMLLSTLADTGRNCSLSDSERVCH
jgi:hypothetical protein